MDTSKIFNLFFPQDNVYGVKTGETKSVCDGFWIFIKPLPPGRYFIYFRGLTFLQAETLTQNSMKNLPVYANTREQINQNVKDEKFCTDCSSALSNLNNLYMVPYPNQRTFQFLDSSYG